jgi:hypothetical protein
MTAIVVEPPRAAAVEWVRESLGDGDAAVSAAVLAACRLETGRVRAIVASDTPEEHLSQFHRGGVFHAASGPDDDLLLAQLLDRLAGRGGSCVVIEDDLRRRHDPAVSLPGVPPSAFIGERVVHWTDIQPADKAIATIYAGASGYPRNAFVVAKSCAELGLADRQELDDTFADSVAKSLLAVLVAAYDAESFLLWEPGGMSDAAAGASRRVQAN